jgi:hypothetical protein
MMKPCITIKIKPDETWHIKAKKNASKLLISAVIGTMENNYPYEIEFFEHEGPEEYYTLKGRERWGNTTSSMRKVRKIMISSEQSQLRCSDA